MTLKSALSNPSDTLVCTGGTRKKQGKFDKTALAKNLAPPQEHDKNVRRFLSCPLYKPYFFPRHRDLDVSFLYFFFFFLKNFYLF